MFTIRIFYRIIPIESTEETKLTTITKTANVCLNTAHIFVIYIFIPKILFKLPRYDYIAIQ